MEFRRVLFRSVVAPARSAIATPLAAVPTVLTIKPAVPFPPSSFDQSSGAPAGASVALPSSSNTEVTSTRGSTGTAGLLTLDVWTFASREGIVSGLLGAVFAPIKRAGVAPHVATNNMDNVTTATMHFQKLGFLVMGVSF